MLFVIDLTDAFKQGFIERNLILEIGHHGGHFLLNLTELGCLICLGKGIEHTAYTVEQAITLLKGQDGVLERSRILVLNNLRDVITSLLDSCLKGGQIVRGLDLTEIRCSKGHLTLLQQGILALSILTGRNLHHQG